MTEASSRPKAPSETQRRSSTVLIVPGAAVRRYLGPVADELRARGVAATVKSAPAAPEAPADLRAYSRRLSDRLVAMPDPPDLVVGLSFGT